MNEAVIGTDFTGRIRFMNDEAERLTVGRRRLPGAALWMKFTRPP
ncbi:hypothetical protein [Verrucomicrobium spinosum]|nr:hypothetical protein [Verrucomicrobium spinosum]